MWPDGNKVYDGEWNNDHPHVKINKLFILFMI